MAIYWIYLAILVPSALIGAVQVMRYYAADSIVLQDIRFATKVVFLKILVMLIKMIIWFKR
ncbi:hypothetical protein SAMN05444266_101647 [Chitinophaga jiangningensis]|uniref:Uncharacterized protein n=1 Tax=Chitinophaga jiangningensis TaxID=1419482 RepID=A0A1M6WJ28_9BACT|nr:hypothetical protein [Chitinophaga jiangningensis]SHK93760.1 hypothetical protein SAMN05444266_101647 [Chitinophaga jiangningensis]